MQGSQTERGQTVCQKGPYRLVRHPGYVGGIMFGFRKPLVLGSLGTDPGGDCRAVTHRPYASGRPSVTA